MALQINERVRALGKQAEAELSEQAETARAEEILQLMTCADENMKNILN